MEHWKDIDGFPGYQVSNEGRIRSFYRPIGYGGGVVLDRDYSSKFLHPTPVGSAGHLRVTLYKNGERYPLLVHRLVADAFIPNPNNYPVVRHLDDNPANNFIENLEWGTQRDNVQDSVSRSRMNYDGMQKYNAKRMTAIKAINVQTGQCCIFESQGRAARELGISQGNIWSAMKRNRPTRGYRFEYVKEVD